MNGKRLLGQLAPSYLLVAVMTVAALEAQRAMSLPFLFVAVPAALAAGGVCWLIVRRISRSLEEVKHGVICLAHGDLTHRLPAPGPREIAALAEAVNLMAGELEKRLEALVQQQQQHEAILFSMVESVFAVDSDERLLSLNRAGSRLLRARVEDVEGRRLQEVVRNPALERLVSNVLSTQQSASEEIVIRVAGGEERILDAQGTVLLDVRQRAIGALVVLHDITRVRKLEIVRRDFVANVSHELKTPVTSIKGFVETLLDGALSDPADAERFLKIVAAQADRLTAIIEDLLMLSRIEQGTDKAEIALEPAPIHKVLQAAVDICQLKAAEKAICVEIECEPLLTAECNAALLEQAVVN
ncbi:MAG: PAS domain-containing protein, partial [Pirellulales bacterium]|nr:PAS domain-containing protein [Pirellulales bacterium]